MSAIEKEAEFQLGRVALQCRRRRRSAVWLDLGGSWIHLMLTPLIAGLFLTMAVFAACQHFAIPRNFTIPVTVFLFVASAIIIYSIYFSAPDTISLALHKCGFRYKKRLVRFSELSRIRAGRFDSGFAEAFHGFARLVGTFHRGARMAADMKEVSDRMTLTVAFKDGRLMLMKNALIEFEKNDLEQFFDYIRDEHPELLDDNQETHALAPTHGEIQQTGTAPPATLDLSPKTRDGLDPTYGDPIAREIRNAFAQSNYRSASLLLGVTKDPKLREFYVRSLQEWRGRPHACDKWKREEPDNPNAWLVSGANLIDWAWEARGSDRGDQVNPQAWSTFHRAAEARGIGIRTRCRPAHGRPHAVRFSTACLHRFEHLAQ